MEIERHTYATPSQRLRALVVDFFICIAVWHLVLSISTKVELWIVPYLAASLLVAAYQPMLHGLYGQTIGKMLLRIYVRKLNGEQIGWANAAARSSVDLVSSATQMISVVIAWSSGTIESGPFHSVAALGTALASLPTSAPLRYFGTAWMWSEIITMLTNRKRRAVHDFLGGTVVLRRVDSNPSTTHSGEFR